MGDKMEKNTTKINIQPQAGVMGVFSRLNYKPWYAIAEFVDNSTQSFYSNEKTLMNDKINKVTVHIDYDFEKNILTITDDAFGMEIDDFSRAVKIDSPPESDGGRNEFGMGLKTAASWFGNTWSVRSTEYGSTNEYYTEVDIQKLREDSINTIDVETTTCNPQKHGTVIEIKDITKKIDGPRTKGKIIALLESMYRRDLNSGKVNIWFNDIPLHFDEYGCLTFREQRWKKEVDFSFEFDKEVHHVKGFVGILENGGFGKAGFALFRRGRVVIGGEEQNYKPSVIFGQAQSPIAHKLFGELDLDDFPVNQAKDGFVWDDGLEIEFVDRLKEEIQEYVNIAKMTNKERAKEEEFSGATSDDVQEKVQPFADAISDVNLNRESEEQETCTGKESVENETEKYKRYLHDTNEETPSKSVGEKRSYVIAINEIIKQEFVVEWSIGNKSYWINVEENNEEGKVDITINMNHPFFKPYSNDADFKAVLEKFVIAFVAAEQQAKTTSTKDGYIHSATIRHKMNEFLSKMPEDE